MQWLCQEIYRAIALVMTLSKSDKKIEFMIVKNHLGEYISSDFFQSYLMMTSLIGSVSKVRSLWNRSPSETISIQPIQTRPSSINGVGNLRAIAALGEKIAWVGGTEGKIAKTEDGGATWTLCSLPYEKDLDVRALSLMNPKVACAMCAGPGDKKLSRIYRTVDGGRGWNLVLCPDMKGVFFNAMVFWNDRQGIVLSDPVGSRFALFRTENGGETWERIIPIEMPFAMPGENAFAASNSSLAVQGKENVWFATGGGASARVFYSCDGGRSWGVAATPMKINSVSAGIFSLAFLNEKLGIAVGGDHKLKTSFPSPNILITRDGGRNWEIFHDEDLSGKYLSSVAWRSEDSVKVVDGSKEIFNAVAFSETTGWAVGPNQAWAKI